MPANAPQTRAAERVDEPDWRTLFAGPSSRATLARISDGDPLGLEARCRERIAARALLIDLERAVQCVLANVAFFAPRYKGSPPFEYWLRQRVDAGLARAAVVATLRAFKRAVGVCQGLAQLGIAAETFGDLARRALDDPCMLTNPRQPSRADLEAIYESASQPVA